MKEARRKLKAERLTEQVLAAQTHYKAGSYTNMTYFACTLGPCQEEEEEEERENKQTNPLTKSEFLPAENYAKRIHISRSAVLSVCLITIELRDRERERGGR